MNLVHKLCTPLKMKWCEILKINWILHFYVDTLCFSPNK